MTSSLSIVAVVSFSRLRSALDTVIFAVPVIAPVQATGIFTPFLVKVARVTLEVIEPRR